MPPASPDRSFTTKLSAVAVEWCHADQTGDLAPVEESKFWQFSEKDLRYYRTDTGNAAQEILSLPPGRTRPNEFIKTLVETLETAFKPIDMRLNVFTDGSKSLPEPVPLGGQHFDHLPPTNDDGLEFAGLFVRELADFGFHGFPEDRQDLGIDQVGLRQPACRTRKVADLAWIDHNDRQSSRAQDADNRHFQTTGRLQYDKSRTDGFKLFSKPLMAHFGIFNRQTRPCRMNKSVQPFFRYIDANVYFTFHHFAHPFPCPALQIRAPVKGPQTTVRANGSSGVTTLARARSSRSRRDRSITSEMGIIVAYD